jgi:hypothetical protein
MALPDADENALIQAGVLALRGGDFLTARQSFEHVVAAGRADGAVLLSLAHACGASGDTVAALAAVDAALAREPRNLRALVMKGDHLAAAGQAAAAAAYYQAVVRAGEAAPQLPAELRPAVARARAQCERYAQEFEAHLQARLAEMVAVQGPASARFAQSLDLLFGKRQLYMQQPRLYCFPELPQIQFYPRDSFAWMDRVESATEAIREELRAVLAEPAAFTPYVQGAANRPATVQGGMLNNPDWGAYYLWHHGAPVAEHVARCPRTMEALAEVPLARVPGRSPSVLFSLLRPGARIPPHHGFVNTRLICHLPLIVPPGCGFRVGNDTREWVEGRAWAFDDTIEHEAWNNSESTRVILLFEVWRPELTEAERALVGAMFEAIDQHRGGAGEWSI